MEGPQTKNRAQYNPLTMSRHTPLFSHLYQGVARVGKRVDSLLRRLPPSAAAVVEQLKEAQETAHKDRVGMWRYGDVGDSDDEFF